MPRTKAAKPAAAKRVKAKRPDAEPRAKSRPDPGPAARIADLRKQLAAANRAGLKLARCFQWDRQEYQSNFALVRSVTEDAVAKKWLAELQKPSR